MVLHFAHQKKYICNDLASMNIVCLAQAVEHMSIPCSLVWLLHMIKIGRKQNFGHRVLSY